jgi:hypothetical protein
MCNFLIKGDKKIMFELSCKELELTKKLNNEDELMDFFKMDFRDLEGFEGLYATNVHCDIWGYKR